MKFSKDLIIVHFQEGFFNSTLQKLKHKVKDEIELIVQKASKALDIHISFWEDRTLADTTSIVSIPSVGNKVSTVDAPAGVVHNYELKGPEVILVGGWFGACINNVINSILFSFFDDPDLAKTGSLDIRLLPKAIYKTSELLSEMSDTNIKNGIIAAFNESVDVLAQNESVGNRGLRIQVLRPGKAPFFEKNIIEPIVTGAGPQFLVSFILDD